jgi:hypothetical protein
MREKGKRGFLERHGVVRNAIREDLLLFAILGISVFTLGLVVSAMTYTEATSKLIPFIY